jgi:hypothetical protein
MANPCVKGFPRSSQLDFRQSCLTLEGGITPADLDLSPIFYNVGLKNYKIWSQNATPCEKGFS